MNGLLVCRPHSCQAALGWKKKSLNRTRKLKNAEDSWVWIPSFRFGWRNLNDRYMSVDALGPTNHMCTWHFLLYPLNVWKCWLPSVVNFGIGVCILSTLHCWLKASSLCKVGIVYLLIPQAAASSVVSFEPVLGNVYSVHDFLLSLFQW